MSLPSLTQLLQSQCPRANPPLLPPLVSITRDKHYQVTKDLAAHLPSTWRTGMGKLLTNRRIIEYQREGRYGSALKLPPLVGDPCVLCKSTNTTRRYNWDYLPQPGVYCIKCIKLQREARDKDRENRKAEKAAFEMEYI